MHVDHSSFGTASQAETLKRVQRCYFNHRSAWIAGVRSRGCSKSSSTNVLPTMPLATHTQALYNIGGLRVTGANSWDVGVHCFGPKLIPRAITPLLAYYLETF